MACAEYEVRSLTEDVATGSAATHDLWTMRRVHKRVWSASVDKYIDAGRLRPFPPGCIAGTSGESVRHKYAVDPWGLPYWLLVVEGAGDDRKRVMVYSFGPNRRRDLPDDVTPGAQIGDDILAEATRLR